MVIKILNKSPNFFIILLGISLVRDPFLMSRFLISLITNFDYSFNNFLKEECSLLIIATTHSHNSVVATIL